MCALRILFWMILYVLTVACRAQAGDAPAWMHAAVLAPVPAHDEKTNAVVLFSEIDVSVQSGEKIKTHIREAYKILRPGGRGYGMVEIPFNAQSKIHGLRGWCIPAQGKDYEVKDKEAVEIALPKVEGSELISDVKAKLIQIPAADPGNIVGYEYDEEKEPLVLQEAWIFQREIPVAEVHYSLQLPLGWEYKSTWLNYEEAKGTQVGGNQWQWTLRDVKAIRPEAWMPPVRAVLGTMIVSFSPSGGASANGFSNWREMGNWYRNLTNGRQDASPQIQKQVATLTAGATTPLARMIALAEFVQRDIRYVAIELGIGGWQPHLAQDVLVHRYGDCKDKVTLLSSMLSQAGIDSYYVVINGERDPAAPEKPPYIYSFNHMVLAIKLPANVSDPSLVATVQHPRLGRLLYFDPTNELTPFGQIGGYLQANYGLLVTPDGGELVELPEQPANMNGIERSGTLTLDTRGTLKGEVIETRVGDRAWAQRWRLRMANKSSDRIQLVEDLLASSLAIFRVTQANAVNLDQTDKPFGFAYVFEAENYAKNAGGMVLVRPCVLGEKASSILETKEQRKFPIEFEGLVRDNDSFQITIPAGYVVEDVPARVDADFSFASYHSKTEVNGNRIHYSRAFEIKELSVPVKSADELMKFYRMITNDERSMVVLRADGK